jgi:hypothetical protein
LRRYAPDLSHLFTGLFVGLLAHAAREAHLNLSNDIGNAGNFVLAVLIGIAGGGRPGRRCSARWWRGR